ncbi:MAG: DnaJ domain-containing protein [Oscillatoriaceae bacterium SKW80]|nr:DnaJ domain-containing protein [Oscillatoriaceae bacterium SKYG93]MCX8119803.1 DnaJ domain-containing protein [Oscillatoriaceae bacterium SKW80]MDW8452093.1 DnaJ domain-containing protein [Oscillatoriaceae cyanobacterium SKYGB_i_bin93]HIK27470.1 J domain-containing protein [Oscillatoriaceae cyanobacterium M7585_C2015_266]
MNKADYYRLLGLKAGASVDEIKASYRRLARQYHPDINRQDRQAHEKFIQIHEAYKFLLAASAQSEQVASQNSAAAQGQPSKPKVTTRKEPKFQENPQLSEVERKLKQQSYLNLLELLKSQRFPRAIALVEGLAQRIPYDPEIRQWQAIAYQRWARQLIAEKQLEKARVYLKKALRTDPHNRTLWEEVKRDFHTIEQVFK